MKNPNKHIRGAWISGLKVATGLGVWSKEVPKSVIPTPSTYILVTSQTKNRFGVAKDCYEWLTTITLSIVHVLPQGYTSTVTLDDFEETVMNFAETITILGFRLRFTNLSESREMSASDETQNVEQRIMVYEQWVDKAS